MGKKLVSKCIVMVVSDWLFSVDITDSSVHTEKFIDIQVRKMWFLL